MRQTFIAIHQAFMTYTEDMDFASNDAQPGNPGARRRR